MTNRNHGVLIAVSTMAVALATPALSMQDHDGLMDPSRLSPPPPPMPPPPPPPPRPAPDAPPRPQRGLQSRPDPIRVIAVRVSANGRELLNERFRVSSLAGANYNLSRGEAKVRSCGPNQYGVEQTAINFRIYVADGRPNSPYRMTFNWLRPGAMTPDCSRSGTQQVGVSQDVTLTPGAPVTIRGDAGVMIELTKL